MGVGHQGVSLCGAQLQHSDILLFEFFCGIPPSCLVAPVLFGLILVLNWVGLGWDGFGLGDLDTRDFGPGLGKTKP